MGLQTVLAGDPAEKADRDTLEVRAYLIRRRFCSAIGLWVTVRFLGTRAAWGAIPHQ